MSEWKDIETAPSDVVVLTTESGMWHAAALYDEGMRKWRIHNFAVCQEYDWEPTHWMPLPDPPQCNS